MSIHINRDLIWSFCIRVLSHVRIPVVEWTVELVLWQYSPNMVKQTQVRLVRDPLLASQVEPGGKLIKT